MIRGAARQPHRALAAWCLLAQRLRRPAVGAAAVFAPRPQGKSLSCASSSSPSLMRRRATPARHRTQQARQLPSLLARRCGDHGVSPDDRLHCRIALHRSRSGQPSQRPPRSMSSIAKPLHGPSLRWIRSDPEDLIPASARPAAWQNQSPSAGSRMRRSGRSTVRGLTDRPPRAGASSSPMAPRTLRRPARAGPRAARPRRPHS